MAEATSKLSILVTGGAESAGLATVKACLAAGHSVAATADDAAGALSIRQAGALPVYPDLCRASELGSVLALTKADALVHAAPQSLGGIPQADVDRAGQGDWLRCMADAVVSAAKAQNVKRVIAISFGYLYEAGHGAAKEGSHDSHDSDMAAALDAEKALLGAAGDGAVLRAGYVYGGNSPATSALADEIKNSRALPSGSHLASWIHEDDLAGAIVALLEAPLDGMQVLNAAAESPASPNEFAIALGASLGLSVPQFSAGGWMKSLRRETMRDKLLGREVLINSGKLREMAGWKARCETVAAGLESASLVWRMRDAVNPRDYYELYEDEASAAIDARRSGIALPAPVVEAEAPAQAAAAAEKPAPVKAAAPPPSDGPTPWNEDEAKREERRRKALERKAKRAAMRAGG